MSNVMKKINSFKKIHFLFIISTITLYATGIFNIDKNWEIKHPQIGVFSVILILIFFIMNKDKKIITNILKYNTKVKTSKGYSKLFRISVILLILQLLISISTGILMFSKIINNNNFYYGIYKIHSFSRYLIIVLVTIHLLSKQLYKIENKR